MDAAFNSTGGDGLATFRIDGFVTFNGLNATSNGDQDTCPLNLNGVAILSGAWNLGGGSGNAVLFSPLGATFNAQSPAFNSGGTVNISTPLNLAAGSNALHFAFSTQRTPGPGVGLADEGRDLLQLAVTGPGVDAAAGDVPEPAAWMLTLTGFFGLGGAVRQGRGRGVQANA